jgi:hypothetical protein
MGLALVLIPAREPRAGKRGGQDREAELLTGTMVQWAPRRPSRARRFTAPMLHPLPLVSGFGNSAGPRLSLSRTDLHGMGPVAAPHWYNPSATIPRQHQSRTPTRQNPENLEKLVHPQKRPIAHSALRDPRHREELRLLCANCCPLGQIRNLTILPKTMKNPSRCRSRPFGLYQSSRTLAPHMQNLPWPQAKPLGLSTLGIRHRRFWQLIPLQTPHSTKQSSAGHTLLQRTRHTRHTHLICRPQALFTLRPLSSLPSIYLPR